MNDTSTSFFNPSFCVNIRAPYRHLDNQQFKLINADNESSHPDFCKFSVQLMLSASFDGWIYDCQLAILGETREYLYITMSIS